MSQNWYDSFHAKTIVESVAVEKILNDLVERYPRAEEIVESLKWRLSRRVRNEQNGRGPDEKDHIPMLKHDREGAAYHLCKMEINLPAYTYVVCLFTEGDHEVFLIEINLLPLDNTGDLV